MRAKESVTYLRHRHGCSSFCAFLRPFSHPWPSRLALWTNGDGRRGRRCMERIQRSASDRRNAHHPVSFQITSSLAALDLLASASQEAIQPFFRIRSTSPAVSSSRRVSHVWKYCQRVKLALSCGGQNARRRAEVPTTPFRPSPIISSRPPNVFFLRSSSQ